jgi:hypothetical protein
MRCVYNIRVIVVCRKIERVDAGKISLAEELVCHCLKRMRKCC